MREERYVDYEFSGYGALMDTELVSLLKVCGDDHKRFIDSADSMVMADYLEDLGEMVWPTVEGMSC